MSWKATYKQALRGLFVTGTSPVPPEAGTAREKVGDEPGLKTQLNQWVCLA
jgi:hypothetical protein